MVSFRTVLESTGGNNVAVVVPEETVLSSAACRGILTRVRSGTPSGARSTRP